MFDEFVLQSIFLELKNVYTVHIVTRFILQNLLNTLGKQRHFWNIVHDKHRRMTRRNIRTFVQSTTTKTPSVVTPPSRSQYTVILTFSNTFCNKRVVCCIINMSVDVTPTLEAKKMRRIYINTIPFYIANLTFHSIKFASIVLKVFMVQKLCVPHAFTYMKLFMNTLFDMINYTIDSSINVFKGMITILKTLTTRTDFQISDLELDNQSIIVTT